MWINQEWWRYLLEASCSQTLSNNNELTDNYRTSIYVHANLIWEDRFLIAPQQTFPPRLGCFVSSVPMQRFTVAIRHGKWTGSRMQISANYTYNWSWSVYYCMRRAGVGRPLAVRSTFREWAWYDMLLTTKYILQRLRCVEASPR